MKFILCILAALMSFQNYSEASDLSLSKWQATGSQMWHISFPVNGASQLYYPQTADYLIIQYSHTFHDSTLAFEYGNSQTNSSIGSDSDWDYTKNSNLWYYGQFTSAGPSYFARLNFTPARQGHNKIFYGYSYYHNEYDMTNGLYSIENYNQVNDPLPKLSSNYAITYQGPYIGIHSNYSLNRKLSILTTLSYSPLALVSSHGWWNLRTLDFIQTGSGQLADGAIQLNYQLNPKKAASVFIGYRYQWLSLIRGTENTSSTIVWDKATNIQRGVYFGSRLSL